MRRIPVGVPCQYSGGKGEPIAAIVVQAGKETCSLRLFHAHGKDETVHGVKWVEVDEPAFYDDDDKENE